jgi:hypothetical protein
MAALAETRKTLCSPSGTVRDRALDLQLADGNDEVGVDIHGSGLRAPTATLWTLGQGARKGAICASFSLAFAPLKDTARTALLLLLDYSTDPILVKFRVPTPTTP